jgi:hypothetical protein
MVVQWWNRLQTTGLSNGIHTPIAFPFLGKGVHRIMANQIPTAEAYNYLATVGVDVNAHGEIFMSDEEALAYVNFQKVMEGR